MKKSEQGLIIPSINYHLWEPCNMRCKFCFATFQDVKQTVLPKGHLPKEESLKVVRQLASFGFQKITFAGGEPTLCPWLLDLVHLAKKMGMTTMLVSNGTRLNSSYLDSFEGNLDWIALSIDSVDVTTNFQSGRRIGTKKSYSSVEYEKICKDIKSAGIRLKINTVVHQLNKDEIMKNFILKTQPERWKILKVLPIEGQNDLCIDDFIISDKDFNQYLFNNKILENQITICKESNDEMKGSYLMLDPARRFFNNTNLAYEYSPPILKVGIENAIKHTNIDYDKFIKRGGIYNW